MVYEGAMPSVQGKRRAQPANVAGKYAMDGPKSPREAAEIVGTHILRARILPDRRETVLCTVRYYGKPQFPGEHHAVAGIHQAHEGL